MLLRRIHYWLELYRCLLWYRVMMPVNPPRLKKGNLILFDWDAIRRKPGKLHPDDIAIARNGDIYVADGYGNHRVVHMDQHGNLIKAWGEKGKEDGNFDNPHNIVLDHRDRVYVADRYNRRNLIAAAIAVWSAMTAVCGAAGASMANA